MRRPSAAGQRAFGYRAGGDVALRHRLRRAAQLRDLIEYATFVPGIAFDGFDQIGDEL